jgi:hypothetical protein
LVRCNHGVVIISPNFLNKEWPQRELDGLAAREIAGGRTIILPIWHDIGQAAIAQKSPTLADRSPRNQPKEFRRSSKRSFRWSASSTSNLLMSRQFG